MFLRAALWLAGLMAGTCQDVIGSRGCTNSICVFSNSYLRFGSGTESSIKNWGLFQQPWYYSNAWYKLTFSNYPLDTAIGTGNGSTHWSGTTIVNLYDLTPTYSVNDYSGFIVDSTDTTKTVGHGSIIASRIFSISGQNILFQNTFSLGKNDSFVKIVNVMKNNSTNPVRNAYIWVGTRDDYVGITDVNTKTRGNLIGGNFTAITSNAQSSYAIMITNTNEGVLFYSETPGVMTAYAFCCAFSNVYNVNPLTLAPMTPSPTDGSYAAVLPLGTISVNASASITWYYAAGVISSLGSVAQTVAAAQVADVLTAAPSATSSPVSTATPSLTSFGIPTRITTFTAFPVPTASARNSSSASASASSTSSSSVSVLVIRSSTGTNSASIVSSATATGTSTATTSATSISTETATGTGTTTPTGTPTPTTTITVTQTGTATSSSTPSATQTSSVTSSPSTTPILRIFLLAATPQQIIMSAPDYTPFIYFIIPAILSILCCCILCCFGACYYKKYLDPTERQTEPQTASANTDIVQIRTVEETKDLKNTFKRTGFSDP